MSVEDKIKSSEAPKSEIAGQDINGNVIRRMRVGFGPLDFAVVGGTVLAAIGIYFIEKKRLFREQDSAVKKYAQIKTKRPLLERIKSFNLLDHIPTPHYRP